MTNNNARTDTAVADHVRSRRSKLTAVGVTLAVAAVLVGGLLATWEYTRNQRLRKAEKLFNAGAFGEAGATYCTAFLLDSLNERERRTVRLMRIKCAAEVHDDGAAVEATQFFLGEHGGGLEPDDAAALLQYLSERNCPRACAVIKLDRELRRGTTPR
jgi:hypothetical protein